MNTDIHDNERKSDHYFNPFMAAKSSKAKQLLESILAQFYEYELAHNLRKRSRRPKDQEILHQQIDVLLSGLVRCEIVYPNEWLYVPFSNQVLGMNDRYGSPVLNKTFPRSVKVLSAPEHLYAEYELGCQNPFEKSQCKRTRIRAGKAVRKAIKELGLDLEDYYPGYPQELIVLRSCKTGAARKAKSLPYIDTEETNQWREQLQKINVWLEAADIAFDRGIAGKEKLCTNDRRLIRIFNNGSFEQGGRLYGAFWLEVKKHLRQESIVTLDFGQMAARILYGMEGVKPNFKDAYCLPEWTHKDTYGLPGLNQFREGVKVVFNSMLYSDERPERFPKGAGGVFKRSIFCVDDVIDAIMAFHAPIKHHFYSGSGLNIMFRESQILIQILLELISQGVVALPIHDALVVQEDHAEIARETMLRVFHEHTGLEGEISIEEDKKAYLLTENTSIAA